jgi:glycosyltransferase involved in cell wall biosynthesis
MKIAICTPLKIDTAGGVEKHIVKLAQALHTQGLAVEVFCSPDANGRVTPQNHASSRLPFHPIAQLHPEQFHILHTHSCQFSRKFIRFLLTRNPRQRYVHTIHNVAFEYMIACRSWWNWRCYWATATEMLWSRSADHVITVSERIRRLVRRGYGIAPNRITSIPNGADPLDPHLPDRRQLQQRLNLNPDDINVLFVGRGEDRVKGTQLITESMNSLSRQFPQLKLIAAPGTGFAKAPWLQQTGPIEHTQLLTYYAAADIFVNASLNEGMPLTIVEAMAAGLPIVAAPVGGIPQIITHNHTGLLLQPNRLNLTQQLRKLIEDPPLRQRLGQNARQTAQNLTWENIARQTAAIYCKLFT